MVLSPPAAKRPQDRLWQLQFRKEHNAILERCQELERMNATMRTEYEKRLEAHGQQLDGFQTQLVDMQKQCSESEKKVKSQASLLAEFKESMISFLRQRNLKYTSEEDARDIMEGRAPSRSRGHANKQGPPVPSKQSSVSSKEWATRRPRPLPLPPSAAEDGILAVREANRASPRTVPTKQKDVSRTKRSLKHVASNSTDRRDEAIETILPPRLTQGTSTMRAYHEASTAIFKSLSITNKDVEIDFVNAFLRGITEGKNRELLLAHLQQVHLSKQKKGGVVVLCEWVDLLDGLKRTGLLTEGQAELDSMRQKRGMDPRNGIEMTLYHY